MNEISLNSSIKMLPGVGPTMAARLSKLGIFTIRDVIYSFPRQYEERGNVYRLSSADTEAPHGYILTVASEVHTALIRKGMTVSKFRAIDESGAVEVVFFNSQFVKDVFHVGDEFRFFGKLSLSKKSLQLVAPKYEPISENTKLPYFVPVYSLTKGISSNFLNKLSGAALSATMSEIIDPLPENIRLKYKLPTLTYAIKNMHFPADATALRDSVKRLAFDELLYFGIGISRAAHTKRLGDGIKFTPCDVKPLLSLLPYELTDAQKQAVNDVYKDTVIGNAGAVSPMSRIIVGDVGSGKTICATIAIFIAASSKYQSALMAPTEILAKQHYDELKKLFGPFGITVELLLGSTTKKEKSRIYTAIENGECDVIIGTHAVISEKVSFKQLGLVITDEQHRFGVNQRAELRNKAERSHMLVMSATPIPRTLALTMYGDLDVSKITEMPKGRMKVDTFVVDETYRARLNDFITKQVAAGGQCYVVCPAIEAQDESDDDFITTENILSGESFAPQKLKNAVEYAENLKQTIPNLRIGLLHGKMKPQEKADVMNEFSQKNIDVLVSTTVVEVGINVPNANLMIIENAERFGLAQLHQLRGRVGRGTRKSYCVLVSGQNTQKAKERLEIMRTTYNGFEIAEKDLLLRGPGDFFSSNYKENLRQSGGFDFKIASIYNDVDILNQAFEAAREIVSEDPDLLLTKHHALNEELTRMLSADYSTIS